MATPPSWSELPQELLCLIIDRLPQSSSDAHRGGLLSAARSRVLEFLPFAAAHRTHLRETCRTRHSASIDRARFRAVCRSWKAAVSAHAAGGTPPRWVPWIVLSDGSLMTPDGADPLYVLPSFPENARCLGSTDGWLAVDRLNSKKRHRYFLHNPFTRTTVPLRELRGIIGRVSRLFKVHKVLMRSTPDDVVALLTNNWNYPIILIRPGKGMWLPKPRSPPYVYIIDIAFLGDKLYGIIQALDLVSLDIAFDVDGVPSVTGIDRLIRHPSMDYDFHVWSDNEEDGEYERKRATDAEANEEDDDRRALYQRRRRTGDGMILEAIECWDDEEVPYEPKDFVTVSWHLVESCGKLLMVRRHLQIPEYTIKFTREVEVFEANVNEGEWVPVASELSGQGIFISKRFCKSIPAREEVQGDAIYFVDTGEMFNATSQTMSRPIRDIDHHSSTWIFSSELVV